MVGGRCEESFERRTIGALGINGQGPIDGEVIGASGINGRGPMQQCRGSGYKWSGADSARRS